MAPMPSMQSMPPMRQLTKIELESEKEEEEGKEVEEEEREGRWRTEDWDELSAAAKGCGTV